MTKSQPTFQRLLPQAIEIECVVLGAMLLHEEALNIGMESLRSEYFFKMANRHVFDAISKLFEKGERTDLMTVPEKMIELGTSEEAGGAYYVSVLSDMVSSPAGIKTYIGQLREKSALRELIACSDEAIDAAYGADAKYDKVIGKHLQKIDKINEGAVKSSMLRADEAVGIALEDIHNKRENPTKKLAIRFGFEGIDRIVDINQSDFIVLAARPSMGKTALALNIAANIIKQGFSVGILSLEMTTLSLMHRIISAETKIDAKRIKNGYLNDDELTFVRKKGGEIYDWPLYIDDTSGLDVNKIKSKAKIMKMRGIDFFIYDFLQRSHYDSNLSVYEAVKNLSRAFKDISKELGIPVLVLSQLSRAVEQRTNKRPQLSDLRDSGSIEEDADLVMFIYREWVYQERENPDADYDGTTEINIAKQRNGPTGRCKLNFVREFATFTDLAHEGEEPF